MLGAGPIAHYLTKFEMTRLNSGAKFSLPEQKFINDFNEYGYFAEMGNAWCLIRGDWSSLIIDGRKFEGMEPDDLTIATFKWQLAITILF